MIALALPPLASAIKHHATLHGKSLAELETIYRNGKRTAIEALRYIKMEEKYTEEGFTGWEAYVDARHGKSQATLNRELRWLEAVEFLEVNGVSYHDAEAASVSCYKLFENDPEMFLRAYKQVLKDGRRPDKQAVEDTAELLRLYDHRQGDEPVDFEGWRQWRLDPVDLTRQRRSEAATKQHAKRREAKANGFSDPRGAEVPHTPANDDEGAEYVQEVEREANIITRTLILWANVEIPGLTGEQAEGRWTYSVDAAALRLAADWLEGCH